MAHTLDDDEINSGFKKVKEEEKVVSEQASSRYYITLFEPRKGKETKQIYPELASHPEFQDLSNKKLHFVWLMSNATSPLVLSKMDDRKKLSAAIVGSQLNNDLSDDELSKWKSGFIPDDIKVAMKRMSIFNPDIRARAKSMAEKMFNNLETILHDEIDEETGLEQRAWYIDQATKANKTLPELVNQIELAYGIQLKKEKGKDSLSEKMMDKIIGAE